MASLRFRVKAFFCEYIRGYILQLRALFDFGGDGRTNRLSQGLVVAWDSGTPLEGLWSLVPATWPSTRRPG